MHRLLLPHHRRRPPQRPRQEPCVDTDQRRLSPTPALVTAFPPPTANMPLPESGDSSDVEVVSGPQRPVAELVDIADDDSDAGVADGDSDAWEEVIDGNGDSNVSGGSSDVHDEVVDTSDVEVVVGRAPLPGHGGGSHRLARFSSLAPTPLSPPPSPPLPTWHEYTSRTTGLSFYVNSTTRETVYAKPAELRGPTSEADVAVVPAPAPAPTPTPAPPPMPRGRLRWPRATRRDWHAEANRQFAAETHRQCRRSSDGGSNGPWYVPGSQGRRQYTAEMNRQCRRSSGGNIDSNSSTVPQFSPMRARAPALVPALAAPVTHTVVRN